MKHQSITVRVPASTSNLGPGFDTLGVALKLYNRVRVTPADSKAVTILSDLDPIKRDAATTMATDAARLFFERARRPPFGMMVRLNCDVPISRGLGSSVTLRLGIIAALNELTRAGFDRHQLMELAAELEHHPDNSASAAFGGFTAAGFVNSGVRCLRFPVSPRLKFVTLIPRFEISTLKARRLVPPTFNRADTLHNLNRSALISAAFAAGDYEALRGVLEDRVHQPYREQLVPQLTRIIKAGEKAGAIGGWLSGSGPVVVCITLKNPVGVARAMRRKLPASEVRILTADNEGVKIVGR